MASKRAAKKAARTTSRRVYRGTRKKGKQSLRKILANFAGKSAYKKVRAMRGRRRMRRYGRKMRY